MACQHSICPPRRMELIFLVFYVFCNLQVQPGNAAAAPGKGKVIIQPKKIDGHRKINWAITGVDEPLLHVWPFNQFPEFLQKDKFYPPRNEKYRYRLEFNEIYSRVPGVGRATINCVGVSNSPWCPTPGGPAPPAPPAPPPPPGSPPPPPPQPPAPLPPTDYSCDPGRKNCDRPDYNFTKLRVHSKLYKTVHIILYAEMKRNVSEGVTEKWIPAPLEGVLLQGNHDPSGVGLPTGEFYLDQDYSCVDCPLSDFGIVIPARKRSRIEVVHPNVLAFHHENKWFTPPDASGAYGWGIAGKRGDIHANYRWYSPPCTETRRLQFTLLAVHSFKDRIYDILEIGPYEVSYTGTSNHSNILPSPVYFPLFYHDHLSGTFCHAANPHDLQTVHYEEQQPPFKRMDFSHSFDTCVREELNPRRKEVDDIRLFLDSYVCDKPALPACPYWTNANTQNAYSESAHGSWSQTACATACPTPPPPVPPPPPPPPKAFFKRGLHGSILIMTNFCIMPINTFIARFYKETFNTKEYKGQKLWFWMHVLGNIISCILIYIATFTPGKDLNDIAHVYLAKVYIIMLAICYFTSWGRHNKHVCNMALEFVHGVLGYSTIILAHLSMHYTPNVGHIPKFLVDFQICLHALFILIVTFDICIQDNKVFGMRPNRRHLPTVAARFDDIPIPRHKFRIALLIILSVVTFACSVAANFFE